MIIEITKGPRGGNVVKAQCDVCNKQYVARSKTVLRRKKQYCSRLCHQKCPDFRRAAGTSRIGVPHSEESKQKLRNAMLSDKHPHRGKKLSEEHKRKISENHWWNGRVVPWFKSWMISDYTNWRDKIKELFDNQCASCGVCENLHSHHIVPKSIAEDRELDLNNGICLCKDCHVNAHRLLNEDLDSYVNQMNEFSLKRMVVS